MGSTHRYDHAPLIARVTLATMVASLGWGASFAAAKPAGHDTADLGARLGAALHAKGIGPARTGAVALDLLSGRVVFAHNSAVGFVPASNEKLPVTYAALKVLGPNFRFPTEVRGQGTPGVDGTWNGKHVHLWSARAPQYREVQLMDAAS
jgi:D-alanyl-D-alanine carboxypeptidase